VATADKVWRAADTSPGDIDAALRRMLAEIHHENDSYVPARVLNLVVIVDREYSGEIANRLSKVGRYHPSRTVVCTVEPDRTTLDAVAMIAAPADPKPGEFAMTRETVLVACGPKHLTHLDSIVDPLVVTDLTTVTWSPHGYQEAVDSLLHLSQSVLVDSVDEPEPTDAVSRAQQLADEVYVVDLAWLRSTPWRERVAATFDPPQWRPDLWKIEELTISHHPESAIAGLLLVGWLASRLGWKPSPLLPRSHALEGTLHARRQDIHVRLESDSKQSVRGLAGLEIKTASGMTLSLDRGEGGLRARRTTRKGKSSQWIVLGASRGEAGILGEGIRQALLRDPTYLPALDCAAELAG
jgi:glucose-6-phosphate dehydrogenase assembly protein OpcA